MEGMDISLDHDIQAIFNWLNKNQEEKLSVFQRDSLFFLTDNVLSNKNITSDDWRSNRKNINAKENIGADIIRLGESLATIDIQLIKPQINKRIKFLKERISQHPAKDMHEESMYLFYNFKLEKEEHFSNSAISDQVIAFDADWEIVLSNSLSIVFHCKIILHHELSKMSVIGKPENIQLFLPAYRRLLDSSESEYEKYFRSEWEEFLSDYKLTPEPINSKLRRRFKRSFVLSFCNGALADIIQNNNQTKETFITNDKTLPDDNNALDEYINFYSQIGSVPIRKEGNNIKTAFESGIEHRKNLLIHLVHNDISIASND